MPPQDNSVILEPVEPPPNKINLLRAHLENCEFNLATQDFLNECADEDLMATCE